MSQNNNRKPGAQPVLSRKQQLVEWYAVSGKMLVFLVLFFTLALMFYAFWSGVGEDNFLLKNVLHINAVVASFFLNIFGYQTTAVGSEVNSSLFNMKIAVGCDGIEPITYYMLAILAYPTVLKRKLTGIGKGVALLLMLNFIRVISLYLVGVYIPSLFDFFHVGLWQALFILAGIALLFIWLNGFEKFTLKNKV